MLNHFCEIHCFWHFQNFQAWCLQTPIIRFFHFWIVYSYYSRPFLQNRPWSGTNKRQLWRFTSVLHVTLCCFTLQHCMYISAGASKLCDGDLSGWAFHLGPGAGHQGDGGHVARNAGGDGNCWGMFQQHRPVCFSCLLCRAFSTVQVDWNESLQMTKCVVKLYQLMLLGLQTAFAQPQGAILCRFLLWQIILTPSSSRVRA